MILPSIEYLYEIYKKHPQIQTDTRKLIQGDLYFALKGPHFNGNSFAITALQKGAAFVIIDEPSCLAETDFQNYANQIIEVKDSLVCLQSLAHHHRKQFTIPFIGITGSNGKTTTKELIAAVLSSHFKTYTTKGNLNNHIGVPLTILSIPLQAQMAVIEMGANHVNEIESYCAYAMPNFGLITNCGKAHLEGFGSEAGVKKGKGELYDFLRGNNGTVFLMQDYDYLVEMSKGIQSVISYGQQQGDLKGKAHIDNDLLQVEIIAGSNLKFIHTQLVGDYNLPNVLAAICIGQYFKVPDEKIKTAIEQYMPTNSRSQLIQWNGHNVILDAYNANPSSMKVAIDNFANIQHSNKIVCLGGMKELGKDSNKEHQLLIANLEKYDWNKVLLVGGDFKKCTHSYCYFETVEEAKKWMVNQQLRPSFILIKGSRSIQMELLIA